MDNNNDVIRNSNGNNTEAIVSMILGILSVVLCWLPIVGLILAIIAIVLGVRGLKKANEVEKGKGFAIAGLSCGIVGLVLNIIYSFVWLIWGMLFKTLIDESGNIIDRIDNSVYYNTNSSYSRYTYNYENDLNNALRNYRY